MKKVTRNDGLYYQINLNNGKYYIDLYNNKGIVIDGIVDPFDTEETAYRAAGIAAIAFAQGQQNILNRQ
ncbi:hypothetical protein ACFQZE_06925 [Paenibacillus sp. GCM10027627]